MNCSNAIAGNENVVVTRQGSSVSCAWDVHLDADGVYSGVGQQQWGAVADGMPANTIAEQLPLTSPLVMETHQQLGALGDAVEFREGAGAEGREDVLGVAEGVTGSQQPHQMQQQCEISQQSLHVSSGQEQQQQQQQHNQWHSSTSRASAPTPRGGIFPLRSRHLSVSVPTHSDSRSSDAGPLSACSTGGNDAVETPTPTPDHTVSDVLWSEWWHLHYGMEGMTMEGSPINADTAPQWPCADVDIPSIEGATSLAEGMVEIPEEVIELGGVDANSMLGMGMGELNLQDVADGGDNWDGKVSEVNQDWVDMQKQWVIDDMAALDEGSFHGGSNVEF